MSKMNKYKELADKFAELIEKNEAPWQKSWSGNGFLPYNIKTSREYNGINLLNLMSIAAEKGYEDNRWLTFLQASEQNAKVRTGEKGTPIMYLQTTEKRKEIDKETGEEIVVTEKLEKPRAVWSVVFNAEQCEGLPAYEQKQINFNPIEKAESILNNSGAKIKHKAQDRAYYSPVTDTITLPLKEQFKSSEKYYRTALHELGHWTGHSSRNNRDLSGSFDSESYAREELVAEISSFLVGTQCGLGHEPDENNIAYLKSWSKAIRDDPSYLFKAVKDADKAAQLILGKELELEQINNNEKNMEKETLKMNVDKNNSVTYINVPREEKDQAKELGAKWDKNNQCWFVHADKDLSLFDKWEHIDEKDLIARKEQLHQNKKENNTEKGFFKDLTVKFAWSEFDFGVKDDTILKGEEAYKFLDKLLKADIEQNKIQERMRNGEKLDEAYYYKTKFVLSYKFHTSENINIYIGEYEFGGKEKVSEAIEHRAKTYSAQIIPRDELQNFKKEEERYLEYLQGKQVNMKNEKISLQFLMKKEKKLKH